MTINHQHKDNKGLFYIGDSEEPKAEMTYSMKEPGKMVILHTEVSDELRGQNAGYQMVHAAVEYAREHQIKIVPLCPFANAVFKKRKEYSDVLYNSES